jgi:tetratricopeptide (TPR) repeat protein
MEWLARYQLEQKAWTDASSAAAALVAGTKDPPWWQIGWYLAGVGHLGGGRKEEARDAFERALKVAADTREGVEAAVQLGLLALGDEDHEAATVAFGKAAERATGEDFIDIRARSYYGLGRAAEMRGDWEEASRYYLGVAVLFDNENLVPEALFRAAEAFDKIGKQAERAKTLEELRERYPGSPWATERTTDHGPQTTDQR